MRDLFAATLVACTTSAGYADVCDYPSYVSNQPIFADDPLVEPDFPYHTLVEEINIVVNPGGECMILNTFPDDPSSATPTYVESGLIIKYLRWQWYDGSAEHVTIAEAVQMARQICDKQNAFFGS